MQHALSKSGLPELDYSFNPYAGCAHGCIYCYARAFTRYKDVSLNWGRVVYIKENIVEVLEKEVKRLRRGIVGVSTITDPYQPVEATERLARRGIEVLLRNGFHVSIQTKSPLVVRDLDILDSNKGKVDVGFTITTMDWKTASLIEPHAPPPSARAEALGKVAAKGLETWVFLGPIIRGVNDAKSSLEQVARVAFETGSKLYYDFYHHRPELAESMNAILATRPLALNASRSWLEEVQNTITKICSSLGIECIPAFQPKAAKNKIDQFLT